MAIVSGNVAVGTAATVIPVTSVMPYSLSIHNADNTDTVYLGGPSVTTATGLGVNKIETLQFDMGPKDRMYVVSTKSGHNVTYVAVLKET